MFLKVSQNFDQIILGIDPGTNILGYGVIGESNKQITLIDVGQWHIQDFETHFEKLKQIADEISRVIDHYKPDSMAIEAPFYGKNIQSMLKLGRAQGVAIATALIKGVLIAEYSPKKVKQAITGKGSASKEQVAAMLAHILKVPVLNESLDATDALAVAVCHYFQNIAFTQSNRHNNWSSFVKANQNRVHNF